MGRRRGRRRRPVRARRARRPRRDLAGALAGRARGGRHPLHVGGGGHREAPRHGALRRAVRLHRRRERHAGDRIPAGGDRVSRPEHLPCAARPARERARRRAGGGGTRRARARGDPPRRRAT